MRGSRLPWRGVIVNKHTGSENESPDKDQVAGQLELQHGLFGLATPAPPVSVDNEPPNCPD